MRLPLYALALTFILLHAGVSLAYQDASDAQDDYDVEQSSYVTPQVRQALIRKAKVWAPTHIPSLDLLNGPDEAGDLPFNAVHECRYVRKKRTGTSPKFHCQAPHDESRKVKYGSGNSEVYATVASNRLFWALGFYVNRNYPVQVHCPDCPRNPWDNPDGAPGDRLFNPAILEHLIPGFKIEEPGRKNQGWSWPELDLVSESAGGATRAEIDALKLLAVFIGHTDSAHRNQRLHCLDAACSQPILYIHDLGTTFGSSVKAQGEPSGSMTYRYWRRDPIWQDPSRCIARLDARESGSDLLRFPKISESGRKFLADLLIQLSDDQIRDLFRASRAERYDTDASVEDWLRTFKSKRRQIVEHRCPK